MSVNYYLEILASSEPEQIFDLISSELNIEKIDEKTFSSPGLYGRIRKTNDSLGFNIIEEAFGFYPTVHISFLPFYNSNEYTQARNSIIKISMVVLNQEPGNAVLTREYEQILFQRLDGELVLNSQYFVLDNARNRVEDINLPYTIQELQSPLL